MEDHLLNHLRNRNHDRNKLGYRRIHDRQGNSNHYSDIHKTFLALGTRGIHDRQGNSNHYSDIHPKTYLGLDTQGNCDRQRIIQE
jgi:hypothetical protein